MRVHSSLAAAVVAASVTILLVTTACDKSPTAPGPPAIGGTGTGSVPIQRLELEAPGSIAPGTTVQLRAFAVSGTQREEVTDRATWRSTDSEVLEVDASGRATGRRDGPSGVQATFSGRSASRSLLVLPPDTWWVLGRVRDGGLGVANARVEIIEGIGTGKSTTTDAMGSFRLYGVSGDVGFRASADGFRTTDMIRRVLAHGTSIDFVLQPAVPPRTLTGEWALTFQAATDCSSLPDAARVRTYRATIEQSGASLRFSLSGAQFALDSNRPPRLQNTFLGRVVGESVTLVLTEAQDYYYYYNPTTRYDVAEQLGTNNVLAFVGTGTVTANGSLYSSGSFSGTISVGPPASGRTSCTRPNHQFSLTR
jgi:hypothetical protein